MKYLRLFIVLSILLLTGVSYYVFRQTQLKETSAALSYNRFTGTWEQVAAPDVRPEYLEKTPNVDGLHNNSLLKAYFDSYDSDTQTLKVKKVLPFTGNTVVELAELRLSPSQTIFCTPENYTDPSTGKSYSLRKLVIPVKDGEVMRAPNETTISFDHFINSSTEFTYLLIQLTQDFDQTTTNYVQKIVAMDICPE